MITHNTRANIQKREKKKKNNLADEDDSRCITIFQMHTQLIMVALC